MLGERSTEPDDLDRRILGWHRSLGWQDHPESLAPYVPSPLNIVKEMLKLVDAGPEDTLYDLGCGDGRILFSAVEEFNVKRAVGFDLNPEMVDLLKEKIKEKDLQDRIEVVRANFMKVDLSIPSIVTLYLTTSGNVKLRPKLEADLKSGTRVISHDFPIHGWSVDNYNETPYIIGSHKLFRYKIPDAYLREVKVQRTEEEVNRWRRIHDMFTRLREE